MTGSSSLFTEYPLSNPLIPAAYVKGARDLVRRPRGAEVPNLEVHL